MAKMIDFWTLLKMTQEHISSQYAAVLTDQEKLHQLKAYVDKYLRDHDFKVEGLTTHQLIDKLYCEMAQYFASRSIPKNLRESFFAVTAVVPLPRNGSNTRSSSLDEARMSFAISFSGFCVG